MDLYIQIFTLSILFVIIANDVTSKFCISSICPKCEKQYTTHWTYFQQPQHLPKSPTKIIFMRALTYYNAEDLHSQCNLTTILENNTNSILESRSLAIAVLKDTPLSPLGLPLPVSLDEFTYKDDIENLSVYGATLSENQFCPLVNIRSLVLESNEIPTSNEIGCGATFQCCRDLRYLMLTQLKYKIVKPPHNALPNLTSLELRSEIKSIENEALVDVLGLKEFYLRFATLREPLPSQLLPKTIEKIQIEYTNVENVPSTFFKNLKRLSFLSFVKNRIDFTNEMDFGDLNNLKYLTIKNHNVREFPEKLFVHLKQLETLDLSENKLRFFLNVSQEFFAGLISIKSLDLSDNDINDLPEGLFQNVPTLQNLSLKTNKLTVLNASTFEVLSDLKVLSLRQNYIWFPNDNNPVFVYLSNLEVLDLRKNRIDEIFKNTFLGLDNLQNLDLSFNKIEFIDENSFVHLKSLKNLLLNFNQIKEIGPEFSYLPSLENLNLDFNIIGKIDENALCHSLNLSSINLRWNALNSFNFSCMISLNKLLISRNQLKVLDYSMIPGSLEELDISANKIENITDIFEIKFNSSLTHLNLGLNQIRSINRYFFCPTLQTINLRKNKIFEIRHGTFSDISQLKNINILENNVRIIDRFALGPTPHDWDKYYSFIFRFSSLLRTETMNSVYLKVLQLFLESQNSIKVPDCLNLNVVYNILTVDKYTYENTTEHLICQKKNYTLVRYCFKNETSEVFLLNPKFLEYKQHLHLDCGFQQINSLPPEMPKEITILNLDGGNISILDDKFFFGLNQIKILYLNNSQIKSISENAFYGLDGLVELHVENNPLSFIYASCFKPFLRLERLYLPPNHVMLYNYHWNVVSFFNKLKFIVTGDTNMSKGSGELYGVEPFIMHRL